MSEYSDKLFYTKERMKNTLGTLDLQYLNNWKFIFESDCKIIHHFPEIIPKTPEKNK